MKHLLLILTTGFLSCTGGETELPNAVPSSANCVGLFGAPNERSGFAQDACSIQCACQDQTQTSQLFDAESEVFTARHLNPLPMIAQDPYASERHNGGLSLGDDLVCAITLDDDRQSYELHTVLRSEVSVDTVTHTGPCGACSSLQDLQVYARQTDLTDPVRNCGIMGISSGQEANLECLKAIGFSSECAAIWYFNTLNTRTVCLDVCLANLNAPYVDEMGQLNPCLKCDEQESGPIFKQISGRTRRNSTIPSAICRPCDSVSRLNHVYLKPALSPTD